MMLPARFLCETFTRGECDIFISRQNCSASFLLVRKHFDDVLDCVNECTFWDKTLRLHGCMSL